MIVINDCNKQYKKYIQQAYQYLNIALNMGISRRDNLKHRANTDKTLLLLISLWKKKKVSD